MLQFSNSDDGFSNQVSKLRKNVSFNLFKDIIYIKSHNPEDNDRLWWSKTELTCIRYEVHQDIIYIMNHSLVKNIDVRGAFNILYKLNK